MNSIVKMFSVVTDENKKLSRTYTVISDIKQKVSYLIMII